MIMVHEIVRLVQVSNMKMLLKSFPPRVRYCCTQVVNSSGVLDCAFHPTQPWLFTAGADGDVLLWCN